MTAPPDIGPPDIGPPDPGPPDPGSPHIEPAEIDARGLLCPLPVLRLRKVLAGLPPGAVVRLAATDPAAAIDVPHFCAQAGHRLVATHDLGGGVTGYAVARGT